MAQADVGDVDQRCEAALLRDVGEILHRAEIFSAVHGGGKMHAAAAADFCQAVIRRSCRELN